MADESWRDGSVTQRNLHMLNSQFMADCIFVVGVTKKKKFHCHKNILCYASSVFYAMFNGGLEEKGEVKVEDIEAQYFRKMLEFIYSDNTDLENVETALSVCYAANKYMINTLMLKCIDFIKENLDEDIVCRALEFARLIDNADLEAESLQYLQLHICEVFNSASFLHAERATLLTILNQHQLCITSEVELFSACIRWAKAHQRGADVTLREVLGSEVLSLIRFLTMTAKEFATIVVPSKLLEAQEERDILCHFVMETGETDNMPLGFSISKENREAFGLVVLRETIEIRTSDMHHLNTGRELNDHLFKFILDCECLLLGLELHGLTNGCPALACSIEVDLLLMDFKLISSAKFEGLMSAGKTVEVKFNKPCSLKQNKRYTLRMNHSNANLSYFTTRKVHSGYTTTARVTMDVDFYRTNISKIYLAKPISK